MPRKDNAESKGAGARQGPRTVMFTGTARPAESRALPVCPIVPVGTVEGSASAYFSLMSHSNHCNARKREPLSLDARTDDALVSFNRRGLEPRRTRFLNGGISARCLSQRQSPTPKLASMLQQGCPHLCCRLVKRREHRPWRQAVYDEAQVWLPHDVHRHRCPWIPCPNNLREEEEVVVSGVRPSQTEVAGHSPRLAARVVLQAAYMPAVSSGQQDSLARTLSVRQSGASQSPGAGCCSVRFLFRATRLTSSL